MTHYHALLVGYGTALVGWLVMARIFPDLWPKQDPIIFTHPWREIGWALLSVVAVLVVGQLYIRGWLFPSVGMFKSLLEALNQIIIFSPLFLLLLLRKHSLSTAWLPTSRIWAHILVGIGLASIAMLAFTIARTDSRSWVEVIQLVYQPTNLAHLVQVFLEDIAIAILFVRFRSALSLKTTTILVAALFAAGHIPALLAGGAVFGQLTSLLLDAGLGVAIIAVVQRSSDVWWFWCVHFAMDMMQFYAVV